MTLSRFGETTSSVPGVRLRATLFFTVSATVAVSPSALAARGGDAPDTGASVAEDAAAKSDVDAIQLLPGTLAPSAPRAEAVGAAWMGYDGAARGPAVSALVSARVTERLVLSATAMNSSTSSTVRPGVSVRLQVLDQDWAGIDAGVSLGYRRDLFSSEGGFFQSVVSVGRRVGAASLIANVAYGQDGEGDDRDGEVRLAVLRRAARDLNLGFDGRVSHSLASTDPNRARLGTPSMTYVAGPLATYSVGAWALMLEAGVTGIHTDRYENGVLTMGGLGAVF